MARSKVPDFASVSKALTKEVVSQLERAGIGSAVLAEAPPGAGKSTLTCSVAQYLVEHDMSLILPIVTQTNEQADDVVTSLHTRFPALVIARLVGQSGSSPHVFRLAANSPFVLIGSQCDQEELGAARVIVGTARKWQYERARLQHQGKARFQFALVDEAYQMRSDALLGIATLFETLFCVGDPGQLDPFTVIDDSLWRGLPYSPARTAMGVLRAYHPELNPIQLPTSWRLPPSAAHIISSAFYPFVPFSAGTHQGQRSIAFGKQHRKSTDSLARRTLQQSFAHGWAYVELEEKYTVRTDNEVASAIAQIVAETLNTRIEVVDERTPGGRALAPEDVAIVTAHNDQVHAVNYELNRLGIDRNRVVVSTANKIQGREYDLVVAWHPLAGRRDASSFHLEAGRMCVMLSRHKQGCVVVGRAGADRLLAEFPDSDPIFLDEPEKFPDGWQANFEVLDHLSGHRV